MHRIQQMTTKDLSCFCLMVASIFYGFYRLDFIFIGINSLALYTFLTS